MSEPDEFEIFLNGPLVQDDVNGDPTRGSMV